MGNPKNDKPKKNKPKAKVFTKKKKKAQPESVVIQEMKAKYETVDISATEKFVDLPLSFKTIKGLKESKYYKLTEIQKASIPLSLQGKDILGAAQTGSGKTLAFLIPILERLYCEQWTRIDGVGALVISPTRELAYQIFETLKKVGKYHDFSAGLIIGGKDLKFERKRMDQCNIVICTPGRLLQHMDENPLFDCVTMKVLVLDEADRCLDMGFKETMNAIIANLPPERQTLLFSATQTKSVQDLARFPTDTNTRGIWLSLLGLEEKEGFQKRVLCSDHFEPNDILQKTNGSKYLKPGAMPKLGHSLFQASSFSSDSSIFDSPIRKPEEGDGSMLLTLRKNLLFMEDGVNDNNLGPPIQLKDLDATLVASPQSVNIVGGPSHPPSIGGPSALSLSLKDPSYVSVNEMTTPKGLQQSYVVCELHEKLPIIWSFIKNHLKQKTIIFLSTCKQVKYFYEIFCKLRPGLSLLPLYGTLHQLRRMNIYEEFCRKKSAVLFATDLAARGLDFPEVHWVVQADCPEDVETYIHRVGRTARYHKGGESLLLLMPSEIKMAEYLEEKKLPIEIIDINPAKLQNPIRKMEAFLARDFTLKDTAQRAVSHYARHIFFMKLKDVFNVHALDFDAFSKSLGLAVPPRIRFLDRINRKQQMQNAHKNSQVEVKSEILLHEIDEQKNKTYFNDDEENIEFKAESEEENNELNEEIRKLKELKSVDSDGSGILESDDELKVNKPHKTRVKPVYDTNIPKATKTNFAVSDDSDEDNMLQIKRKDHDIELPSNVDLNDLSLGRNKNKKPITKAAQVKKMLKKKIVANKKIVFTDEGAAVLQGAKEKKSDLAREYENEDEGGIDIEKAKLVLREEDKFDRQMFRERVKAKHKEEKRKLKAEKKKEEEAERDEFGESEDDEGPDLSWLPDPDKIYGKKEVDSDIEFEKNDNKLSEPMEINETHDSDHTNTKINKDKKSKKRKHKGPDNLETVLKRKKKLKIEQLSSNLNVDESEELALMLLKSR